MTIAAEGTVPEAERARRTWITPLLSTVGALALVIALGAGVLAGVRTISGGTTDLTVSAVGVDTIDVRASAASFTLRWADVREARLEVSGAPDWTLERVGDSLVVRPPARWFGSWFGANERAVLTLPEQLRGAALDAFFSLSAGELRAEGEFGILRLHVSAGDGRVSGSAQDVDVKVSAGQAEVELDDVGRAKLDVSAGEITATLRGTPPGDIAVDVSAGQVHLWVPDAVYAITSRVSAGSFDHGLATDPASRLRIAVGVSAGGVDIRPLR